MRPQNILSENGTIFHGTTSYDLLYQRHSRLLLAGPVCNRKAGAVRACQLSVAISKDGNTLIIDGGDTLQGSPLTYYLSHEVRDVTTLPAQLLNLGGYDFVTLGNHDFD